MWHEEQQALYAEITYLQGLGLWKEAQTEAEARAIDQIYRTLSGKKMASYQEALLWIKAVLAGQWRP